MKKIAIKMMKIAIILIGVICVLLLVSYVNHILQLNQEKKWTKPLGTMVTVRGKQMSIYVQGEGEETLVFMSGGGTCSPILDFKSLYSLLGDKYRIVVVEKFGYGFSDVIDEKRTIDTILEDTRAALSQANIDGKFVLCPHSMSGIEALYWAQKYPDEVSAIIGLDMAVPASYEEMKINEPLLRLVQFAGNIGMTRLIPGLSESVAIKNGTLSEREKEIYKAIFYRRTMTETMIDEVTSIKENAKTVSDRDIPPVPILMFCSDGSDGTGFSKEKWREIQTEFAKEQGNAEIVYLDCGHYVHNYEYEQIAAKIKTYLNLQHTEDN